jgi:hypothetical protein
MIERLSNLTPRKLERSVGVELNVRDNILCALNGVAPS